jgi:hypothetical protein
METFHEDQYRHLLYIAQFFLDREMFQTKQCLIIVIINRIKTAKTLILLSLQLSLHKETYFEKHKKFQYLQNFVLEVMSKSLLAPERKMTHLLVVELKFLNF